jgi:DNA-binding transcriptional regulator/RsmH inhibitor MraZ
MPPFLLQHAGLTKDVVVIGARNHIEVWDRERWHGLDEELVSEVREIRSRVSHAG